MGHYLQIMSNITTTVHLKSFRCYKHKQIFFIFIQSSSNFFGKVTQEGPNKKRFVDGMVTFVSPSPISMLASPAMNNA